MNTSLFLQQYGIAEQSLSPSVKEGINEVLRAASVEGLAQLGKILDAEARKRGITPSGSPAGNADEDAAVLIAIEEGKRQKAAKTRQRIIIIGVSAVVLIVIGVVIYLNRHRATTQP